MAILDYVFDLLCIVDQLDHLKEKGKSLKLIGVILDLELISDGLGIADPSLGKIRSGTGCFYLYTYMPNTLMLPVGTFRPNLNLII